MGRGQVAVQGGVAVGPVQMETEAGARARVPDRFAPDQPAGWALYWALAAVAFILLVSFASTR